METANRTEMNNQECVLVNGPLILLTIMANAFFIFCMVCPLHGERIKQPLKLLLWSLLCCTANYLISIFISFSGLVGNEKLNQISFMLSGCSFYASMTSSVWLNFFYYTQIVPAQRALLVWIKKNIKPLIYGIWIADRIYNLCEFTVRFLVNEGFGSSDNFTMDHDMSAEAYGIDMILLFIVWGHFITCLGVMLLSSGSTVVYLCTHMRRMVANGESLYCPRLRSQVRVTFTGILQGVLYMFCTVWSVYSSMSPVFISSCANFSIFNIYMAGTTFNLGAGQGVFRQRAADVWLRAAQWCKAPQVQQSEQGG